MPKREEIYIRGPFIVPDYGEKKYYLFGTTDKNCWNESSFVEDNKYALGLAYSETGNVLGPWKQEEKPLLANDAGHGMIFETFTGELKLTIHTPNNKGQERPIFIDIKEENDRLYVK